MLLQLSIKNIVLIESVNLTLDNGLTVFTGETGAGKSVILDCLAIALGGRSSGELLRKGEQFGEIIACFDAGDNKEVLAKLAENGIEVEDGQVIFKRLQLKDGKSRAFINDSPVALSFMRQVGDSLLEFHGQNADRDLLQKTQQLKLLDDYAKVDSIKATLAEAFLNWKQAHTKQREVYQILQNAAKEEEFLRDAAAELEKLAVQPGEELKLSSRRSELMRFQKTSEQLIEIVNVFEDNRSPISNLLEIARKMERLINNLPKELQPIGEQLDSAIDAASLVEESLQTAMRELQFDPAELDDVEERLFALRAASRKYKVQIDDLPELYKEIDKKLQLINNSELALAEAEKNLLLSYQNYKSKAKELSECRKVAAKRLEQKIMEELRDLKLEHAQFMVKIQSDFSKPTQNGGDEVEFWVRTNPDSNAGPLMKIASGGELSRFLLALKVVLGQNSNMTSLVFDEVDSGVSGAVAQAIGLKLRNLAKKVQLLAITHLPQVAALAEHHYLIKKNNFENDSRITTRIMKLNKEQSVEEVARMFSGSDITQEALRAAERLFSKNNSKIESNACSQKN